MNVWLYHKLHRLFNIYALVIGVIIAGAGIVIAGSVFPDFDVFFPPHRGWTHNVYFPLSLGIISSGLVIFSSLVIAYLGRQSISWFLRGAKCKLTK